MAVGTSNRDISVDEGKAIVAEAASWCGTPYSLLGRESTKGKGADCSGSTFKIYTAVKLPYEYQRAADFPGYALKSGRFRQVTATEQKQEGDVLSWPDHLAIYSSFDTDPEHAKTPRINIKSGQPWTQENDMWTASHVKGPTYSPQQMHWFKPGPPKVFRYQK